MNTLKAEKRDLSIKAKKLRREGFVTGNLFGHELETSIPLQMEKRTVDQLLKQEGKGGRIMLDVDGTTYHALIRNFLSLGITLLFHIHKGIIGCRQALDFLAFRYFLWYNTY